MWEDDEARKERPRTWLLWNRMEVTRGGLGWHHTPKDQLIQSSNPSTPPIPGNKLGTKRKDQETHCVRHMFMEYSTAVKA